MLPSAGGRFCSLAVAEHAGSVVGVLGFDASAAGDPFCSLAGTEHAGSVVGVLSFGATVAPGCFGFSSKLFARSTSLSAASAGGGGCSPAGVEYVGVVGVLGFGAGALILRGFSVGPSECDKLPGLLDITANASCERVRARMRVRPFGRFGSCLVR